MSVILPKINDKNVFIYWTGEANDFILLMRALMILHSNNGENYKFFIVSQNNLGEFITDKLAECFDELRPAHQADWARVNLIYKYGGIWLDSDMIMINSNQLDEMFKIMYSLEYDGFFVNEGSVIYNGVFGSRANTIFFAKLLIRMNKILAEKGNKIHWVEIGNSLYTPLFYNDYNKKYCLLDADKTIYPVMYYNMEKIVCSLIYETYKEIERPWQPILVITQTGFISELMTGKTYLDILAMQYPLNYFINKSITNQPNNINFGELFAKFPTNTRIGEILNHLINLPRQPLLGSSLMD